jgi:hypothetical protein
MTRIYGAALAVPLLSPSSVPSERPAVSRRSLAIVRTPGLRISGGHRAQVHRRNNLSSPYRHRTYETVTSDEACRLAIEDDDWSDEKSDADNSGETYVSGVWQGVDAAYRGPALPIPSQFSEAIRRKADHFETLLGLLKILAHVENLRAPDLPYWLPKAQAAIAKAEAILASAPDPTGEPDGFAKRAHVLVQLEEIRVRDAIAPIIESDPELTQLAADAITNDDVHAACLAVAEQTDLSEERGAADFRAALAAIREAERRKAASA